MAKFKTLEVNAQPTLRPVANDWESQQRMAHPQHLSQRSGREVVLLDQHCSLPWDQWDTRKRGIRESKASLMSCGMISWGGWER